MINANLEQFLDTGWFNEATLYYNGYTYWCEGGIDLSSKKKQFSFWVYRYKTDLCKTPNGEIYSKRHIEDNDVVDYSIIFETNGETENEVKEKFLQAKIFEGKSFWEVEKDIAWYDED